MHNISILSSETGGVNYWWNGSSDITKEH